MADQEVKIRITTDASGAVSGFRQVADGAKNVETQTQGLASKIKTHWLGISAAIAGAAVTMRKAWDLAEQAAQYEQSKQAFKSMTASMGADASRLYAELKQKSAGLIDDKSLIESANRAMSLGIPMEKLGDLMEIARAKARDMGITTTQAFNDIATGVGRASPKILDNLGLMLKVGTANEKMAASLGKTVEELTDKEKQMAILNATIAAGEEALARHDTAQLTTKEKMEKLTATVKDLSLMLGQGLIRGAAGAVGVFQAIEAASMKASEYLYRFIATFYQFQAATSIREGSKEYYTGKANEWTKRALEDKAAAEKYWKSAKDNFAAMTASADDLAKAMGVHNQEIIDTETETSKKILDLRLKLTDKIKQLTLSETQYKIWQLNREVEEMRKAAGADKQLLDQVSAYRRLALRKINEEAARLADEEAKKRAAQLEKEQEERARWLRERGEAARDLYKDMAGYEEEYYQEAVKLIETQAERYRELMLDELTIVKWVEEEKRKARLALLRDTGTGSFSQGWSEGLKNWAKEAENMFKKGEDFAKTAAAGMSSAFSSVFFDVMKGEFKSLGDYFQSLADTLLKKFTDMIGDMVAEWIMGQARMAFSSGGAGGGGWLSGIGGFIGGLFHTGGIVGETPAPARYLPAPAWAGAPRLHNGLAPDEYPAILQRGEEVLPRGKRSQTVISMPITINGGNQKQAAELRRELEMWLTNKIRSWS